jgi:hypothetical protein
MRLFLAVILLSLRFMATDSANADPFPPTSVTAGWSPLEFAKGELKICHSYEKNLAYYGDSVAQLVSPDLRFDFSASRFLTGSDVDLGDALASMIVGRNNAPLKAVHIPLPKSYHSLENGGEPRSGPLQGLMEKTCDLVIANVIVSKETFSDLGYKNAFSWVPYGPPKVRQHVLVYPASSACQIVNSSHLCGKYAFVSWGTPEARYLKLKNAPGGPCSDDPIKVREVVGTVATLMKHWHYGCSTLPEEQRSQPCVVIGGDLNFKCGEKVWFSKFESDVTDCAYAPLSFKHPTSKGAIMRSDARSLPLFQKIEPTFKLLYSYKILHNPAYDNFRDANNYVDAKWTHSVSLRLENDTVVGTNVPAYGSYDKKCLYVGNCPNVTCTEECLAESC